MRSSVGKARSAGSGRFSHPMASAVTAAPWAEMSAAAPAKAAPTAAKATAPQAGELRAFLFHQS